MSKSNENYHRDHSPNKPISLTSDYLLLEYYVKKRSLRDIGNDCGFSRATVSNWLRYYEIPTRSSKDLIKRINSDFFSKINPDSAFLLGYIFMDGDLQHNLKTDKYFLRLYGKYKDNLVMVLNLLQAEAIIQHRKAVLNEKIRQGELYFIHIADEKIISDLVSLGMIHNKNSYIKFPDIHKDYINHFIRGCWAGSGCEWFGKKGAINSKFVSGSIDFITRLEEELNKAGLKKRNIYKNKHSKSPSFYFTYATEESGKLYSYLYKGSNSTNTINRHTEAFEKAFGQII